MTRHIASALALLAPLSLVLAPGHAAATDLSTSAGFLFDIEDGLGGSFDNDGSVGDGGTAAGTVFDSYDGGFTLQVNGTFYAPAFTAVGTVSGRTITMPAVMIGMLRVTRIIYVPATGGNYIRYVEVVENMTGTAIAATVAINVNLGSDGGEVVTGSSSGDTTANAMDSWFGTDSATDSDLALAFVVQASEPTVRATSASRTSGNVDFTFNAMVPASGRIAIMHFGIQNTSPTLANADAAAIALEPESIYAGLDGATRDALINWGVRTGPCAGADGSACTVTGVGAGRCYSNVCCPGCWDGAACRSGRGASACNIGGMMCNVCDDEDQCTTDTCTAGVCSYPLSPSGTSCNDGAYCTATDRCNATGSCLGTGSPCDDSSSCTTDICDEGLASCMNVMLPETCLIAGTCVASGTANPTNACQSCNTAVSTTAWSPIPTGSACGTERCSAGRFFPGGACNSSGICEPPAARDCPTGTCDGTICEGACTAASCASGTFCSSATLECEPVIANGGGCSLSSTCMSGFCTDGVCCESDCSGTCSRCGGTGRCALIASGADPDRECAGDDVCNGAGMCRMATVADAGIDAGAMDAGTDVGMEIGDTGPEDTGFDGGNFDANIMLPDVPFNVDGGGGGGRDGCSCSAPGTPARHAPLGMLLGLAVGVGLIRRRR